MNVENFRTALAKAGLHHARPIITDGKIQRFQSGEDREKNSWYVLFPGEPLAGSFGCWKRGFTETWCEQRRESVSDAEWKTIRERWRLAKIEQERAETERHAEARKSAERTLSNASPVASHAYLTAKGVRLHGDVREDRGALVLPLRDAEGELHSLQFIRADGSKRFLTGGRIAGCFFTLADKSDGPLVICEGYATGASVYEATGHAVVCALNSGNILAVAKALRSKFPDRAIIIAADNDQFTLHTRGEPWNPGVESASEAAKPIRARLAFPMFNDVSTKPTDFNDLHKLQGLDAVKTQIENAPEASEVFSKPCPDNLGGTHTPNDWFQMRFPKLADQHGEPIHETQEDDELPRVVDISEDFFAATLGTDGQPEAPTLFLPAEERFYSYEPPQGVFVHRREPELSAQLSRLLLECARACRGQCNVSKLEFGFRDTAALAGILRRARATLRAEDDFFHRDVSEFIPCENGMLRLADMKLLPFSPSYRRRNKLAVPFDASAKCPLFLDTLMRPALDEDDLNLLQRWFGLALLGENLAQRILLITGTAGGGKGAFVRVVCGIIGQNNLASLRTGLLGERFELSRYIGRTLLYGADAPDDFLNQKSASVLKALSGGDPITVEFKNSNEAPGIICRFNVIITSNSRLTVHLEGDTDAWRRRLAIIRYTRPKPTGVITDLSERILREEGPGVLNFALAGLSQLRADGWQLHLNEQQQRRVDDLLLESDSHGEFVRHCLVKNSGATLTLNDAYAAYVEFCNDSGWASITRNQFGRRIPDAIVHEHGAALRRDIRDAAGKCAQGWKGLQVKISAGWSSEKASEASAHLLPEPVPEASEGYFPLQTTEKTTTVEFPSLVEELA